MLAAVNALSPVIIMQGIFALVIYFMAALVGGFNLFSKISNPSKTRLFSKSNLSIFERVSIAFVGFYFKFFPQSVSFNT